MSKWTDKTLISLSEIADADRLPYADMSQPEGSRDRTIQVATLVARIARGNAISVAQTAHGFAQEAVLRHDGTDFVAATADSEANAEWIGIVKSVSDVDNFVLALNGYHAGFSGLTPGAYYLQNDGTIGTTPGTIEREVFWAISATEIVIRGGGGGGGGSDLTYDLNLGFPGTPASSALDWILAGRNITIASADPGSAYARTNPSDGDWVGDIQKNGVSVGSVTISTAGAVSWSIASDITLAAGDRLELVAPATADSTAADIQVLLKGIAS